MKDEGKGILLFNGHKHMLTQVNAKARNAPLIELDEKDIDLDNALAVRYGHYTPHEQELVIFYKHDNRMLVLLGRDLIQKTLAAGHKKFQGRLVSTPALKATRILVEAPQVDAPAPETRLPNPSGFENRPRIVDTRQRSDTRYEAPHRTFTPRPSR